jgi:hypothetical protein
MMKFAYLIVFLILSFSLALHAAEQKIVIREYTYHAGEADSKQSARWSALEQAKRMLLEETGTYLESRTEVKNLMLTKDQLMTITGGILQAEIVKETWNGEIYWLQAKMVVDTDSVAKAIDNVRKNNDLLKELEKAKTAADSALAQNEKLKTELEQLRADKDKASEYEKTVRELNSRQVSGAKYLKLAKEAAKWSANDSSALEYRAKAGEFLGEAVVNSELPVFRIYLPGQYVFRLRAGEQTDHWIAGPSDKVMNYRLSSRKGSEYVRVYEDGSVADKRAMVRSGQRFKLRAITDSEIRIVFE